jgi:outer membrane protein assembly factor BamA
VLDRFAQPNFAGSVARLSLGLRFASWSGCFVLAACAFGPAAAQEVAPAEKAPPLPADSAAVSEEKIPSFAELAAAGAIVGEIRIVTRNIFDLQNERENGALYRAANAIHIQTWPGVVKDRILFKSGERVSVHAIEETERLLRTNRIFYDVSIVPVAHHDGVVDIEVRTRDTWTLQPGLSASRTGGSNRTNVGLTDTNFIGSGILVGVNRFSDPDRSGTLYQVSDPHAFDGWTAINYSLSQLSDGENRTMSVVRPFYALDTRWAAGITTVQDTRINSLFENGSTQAQFRHRQELVDAFGGWSRGLVDGWAQRYSIGLNYQKHGYNIEEGLQAPDQLPPDATLVTPYLRYEIVQDRYEKYKNLDLIERAEYHVIGFTSTVQLGRSLAGLGSTQELWLYTLTMGDGSRTPRGGILLTSVSSTGQTGYGPLDKQATGGSIKYYSRPDSRTLIFSSLSADVLRDATSATQLVLGGDTGLRGYPRNYQSGDNRVVLNVEDRVYTDWYPFQLFRVGGAVFYDLGRAWGGPGSNTQNAGWLNDVGFGLRILSARSAFGNVLHMDLAFPLNRNPDIKSVQFLVQTQTTF